MRQDELIFWVDRCLGVRIVPGRLRGAGISIRTYLDLYPQDPAVPDAQWIPDVTARGWIILTKDQAISRNPAELQVLRRAKARYVCLAAKNMTGSEQAECLLEHWRTIDGLVAARKPPVIVKVTRSEVRWHDGSIWRPSRLKKRRR